MKGNAWRNGYRMARGTQRWIPRVILRVLEWMCAHKNGSLRRVSFTGLTFIASLLRHSILSSRQMIPKDSEQRLEVDHRTVLWLLQTWLGVDLTPEGHSVTMRSTNFHVDQKTSETLESLMIVYERVRGRVDYDSYLPLTCTVHPFHLPKR